MFIFEIAAWLYVTRVVYNCLCYVAQTWAQQKPRVQRETAAYLKAQEHLQAVHVERLERLGLL